MQLVAPLVENVSASHCVHEAELGAEEKYPGAQGEHPPAFWNEPGWQVVGGLGVHDVEPGLAPWPDGQGVQEEAPFELAKVSLAQGEQEAALEVELNEPAVQGLQLLSLIN